MVTNDTTKVTLQNPNHPGYAKQVDAPMYQAMKEAFLNVLPRTAHKVTKMVFGRVIDTWASVQARV